MTIKILVEDSQKNLYQGEVTIQKVSSRTQAREELNKIVNEIIEEFETTKLTIKLFNHTIVYKNGKLMKPYTLYDVGEKYQNLVNYYNAILN
jgi:uncharacterized protein YpmS